MFYSYNKFWQLPWQLSSSFRRYFGARRIYLFFFISSFSSWRFLFFCIFVTFLCFENEFAFTSCWKKPSYSWPILYLSVCHLSGIFFSEKELKHKRSHLSFFFFLSSSTEAVLSYSTAPLLFSDTSAWTRAQECWLSDRTLQQAATGWGSGCLMGCGPMWCPVSEFMSGSWRKRPSSRPARCVWQVMLAETLTHLDGIITVLILNHWVPEVVHEDECWLWFSLPVSSWQDPRNYKSKKWV